MPPAPPLEAALLPARGVFAFVSLIGLPLQPPPSHNGIYGLQATGSNVTRSDLGSAGQKVRRWISTNSGASPDRPIRGALDFSGTALTELRCQRFRLIKQLLDLGASGTFGPTRDSSAVTTFPEGVEQTWRSEMPRFAVAAVVAGSIVLAAITSVPASATARTPSGAVTTIPTVVACSRLKVNYQSQIFTFSRCNGPNKAFKKATGDFAALLGSGETALTWKGGTVVEVSIPTRTPSGAFCPEVPPSRQGSRNLDGAWAYSGDGITATICLYEQYHHSYGDRRVATLAPGTAATVAT